LDPTRIEEQEMTLTQPAAIRIAKLVSVITEVDHLCATNNTLMISYGVGTSCYSRGVCCCWENHWVSVHPLEEELLLSMIPQLHPLKRL